VYSVLESLALVVYFFLMFSVIGISVEFKKVVDS